MFKNNFILYIFFLYYGLFLVESKVITTSTGSVKGKLNHYGKTSYNSYEGIPFAEPPVGDLRFKPPVPIKPWKRVLNAVAPGPVCLQNEFFYRKSEMNENCLFLNIYVPVTDSNDLLPVVLFIHGGYYTVGSGKPQPVNGPQLILEKEVIVVTTNYRLGALGFLSFDDINASGNAGLKDILLASKWIKRNINQFGGDPNRICLYGTGSGGILAHYLLLTDQSSGIFHNAMISSGSALSYRALQTNPKHNAIKLAKQLGINYNDDRRLKKLKEIDAFKIIEAEDYIIKNDPRRGFVLIDLFSPVIEKPSSTALITRDPLEIIKTEGLVQKIPIITGFNDQDGLEIFVALKSDPNVVNKLNENFELCIPPNIKYPPNSQEKRNLAESIREMYFGGRNISIYNTQNYINLITDTAYTYSIDYWVKLYKNRKISSAVYYYVFQFDGQLNWGKQLESITYPGACRGDELGYVFLSNVTEHKLQNLNNKSRYVLESILSLLKNFATNGNPTSQKNDRLQWIETDSNRSHLVIDDQISNVNEPPLQERLAFWYREYAKYYEYERRNRAHA